MDLIQLLVGAPVPGFAPVLQLSNDSVVIGAILSPIMSWANFSVLNASSHDLDLGARHPGFALQPPAWCDGTVDPVSHSSLAVAYFSVDTSAGLADALEQVSSVLGASAQSVASALTFAPPAGEEGLGFRGCRGVA